MSTPKDLKLIPRELKTDVASSLKENPYFVDNDPVESHFWSALQCVFPEGERFFIDSARDVKAGLKKEISPELEQQIKTFIHQEAHHGAQHEIVNKTLVEMGYTEIAEFSDQIRDIRERQRKNVPALTRLAITIAGEHFTAVLGRIQLHDDKEFFEKIHPDMQALFLYHAMEEIEHKAVCYDLYQEAGGGYIRRVLALLLFLPALAGLMRHMHVYMLKKDGIWNKENKRKARSIVWGRKGLVWKLVPSVIDYLRPNFHPWQQDDRIWLEKNYDTNVETFGLAS